MSPSQVHLVMIAAGVGAYATFALPGWHGERSRAARHALAALAALVCVVAPFLAWPGVDVGTSEAYLRRAGTVATFGLAALATGLTLTRRPPARASMREPADAPAGEPAHGPAGRPAPDDPTPEAPDAAAPATSGEPATTGALAPAAPAPARPAAVAGAAGDELDLSDTERTFRVLRTGAPSLDLPEGDAWRTVTVGAAGDAALDRASADTGPLPGDPGRGLEIVAGGAPEGVSAASPARAPVGREDPVAPSARPAPDPGRESAPDRVPHPVPDPDEAGISDAEIVVDGGAAPVPTDSPPAGGRPVAADPHPQTALAVELERERLRAERAEAACEGLSAARARAEARAREASRLAREADEMCADARAELERERAALRAQRAATARAVRIAREAIAALAARERSDGPR